MKYNLEFRREHAQFIIRQPSSTEDLKVKCVVKSEL